MDDVSGSKRGESRDFWDAAVQLWTESGLSIREFCRREGLGEHSFHAWRRKLRGEKSPPEPAPASSPAMGGETPSDGRRQRRKRKRQPAAPTGKQVSAVEFTPVRVLAEEVSHALAPSPETAAGAPPIEIVHASGWRVRIVVGFDPTALAAVLTLLERRPC